MNYPNPLLTPHSTSAAPVSLRDVFALVAMHALLSRGHTVEVAVRQAHVTADEMLRQRSKPQGTV